MYHVNPAKKKARIAILSTNKPYFRAREVFRNKEGHYIMTKGGSSSGTHNNPYCVCGQLQSVKIHEAKTDRTARRSR